jgi:pteridine reductase
MNNKTVLITGAARRIGSTITRYLHKAGMNIVIHFNTSADDAEALAAELNTIRPGSTVTAQADLLNEHNYKAIITTAIDFKGHLDVLINNASCFYPTPLNNITGPDWEKFMTLNLKAPLFLSQAAADFLRGVNGCIINITDIHAERPLQNHSLYCISKAGLLMQTKSLAREMGPDIRVNAIAPGAIIWPEDMVDKIKQKILSRTSLKKPGKPEDVAKAVEFLINNAEYVTGQVLTIDGGRTLFS